MYDIFYISKEKNKRFSDLQKRFPLIKLAPYDEKIGESFNKAKEKSLTSFFWVVDIDVIVKKDFKFDYKIPEWDKKYVHVFKQSNNEYGGIYLIPKDYSITKKEAEYKFFINKKEIDIIASTYVPYDQFVITKPEDYFEAQKQCSTSMFYAIPKDFRKLKDFNYIVPEWDRKYVHVFKNNVFLIPKDYSITKKEAEYNFFISNKKIDIAAFEFGYDQFVITKPEDYFEAQKQCSTSMFYAIPKDFRKLKDFNYIVPEWDKKYVHMFKETDQKNGVINLISKDYPITEKEAKHNFFVNKKVVEKNISKISYDQFIISKPEDYFEAQKQCSTSMFYAIPKDFRKLKDFNYIVPEWDKKYVHMFKETDQKNGVINLISKDYPITEKEAKHNFFVNKKVVEKNISKISYDQFIISKPEDYFEAQKKCTTSMFYAVPLDYSLDDSFEFIVPEWDKKYVHMFMANGNKIINLIPKDYPITKKEAEYDFFINKKEIEIITDKL